MLSRQDSKYEEYKKDSNTLLAFKTFRQVMFTSRFSDFEILLPQNCYFNSLITKLDFPRCKTNRIILDLMTKLNDSYEINSNPYLPNQMKIHLFNKTSGQ